MPRMPRERLKEEGMEGLKTAPPARTDAPVPRHSAATRPVL